MRKNEINENSVGVRTARLRQGQPEELSQFLATSKFDEIILEHTGDWSDLSFLVDKKNIITDIHLYASKGCDWKAISQLDKLERLAINTKEYIDIDFSKLSKLRQLGLESTKGFDESVFDMRELGCLTISKFKSDDLKELKSMKKLEWLGISNSRTITNVDGLNELKNIRGINFYSTSLEKINKADVKNLKHMEVIVFDSCKKIEELEFLAEIKNLKTLMVMNCGEIASLSPLKNSNQLDYLVLGTTSIIDGKLSFLFDLEKMRYLGFKNKRHYDTKHGDAEEHQASKWPDEDHYVPKYPYKQDYLSKLIAHNQELLKAGKPTV